MLATATAAGLGRRALRAFTGAAGAFEGRERRNRRRRRQRRRRRAPLVVRVGNATAGRGVVLALRRGPGCGRAGCRRLPSGMEREAGAGARAGAAAGAAEPENAPGVACAAAQRDGDAGEAAADGVRHRGSSYDSSSGVAAAVRSPSSGREGVASTRTLRASSEWVFRMGGSSGAAIGDCIMPGGLHVNWVAAERRAERLGSWAQGGVFASWLRVENAT